MIHVVIRELDAAIRPHFERLLRHALPQNWDDALADKITQWRYFDSPVGSTWVAMADDQCVGMLDAMPRPHLLNGEPLWIHETGDWFCLPDFRFGVGLALLRKIMALGKPIFVIGGSRMTLDLLPHVKFTVAPVPARYYVLPVNARGLAANVIRQSWWQQERLAAFIPPISSFLLRHPCAPTSGNIRIMLPNADFPQNPSDGLVDVIEPWHWKWLNRMPSEVAKVIGLAFYLDNTMVGCSVSQLEPSAAGLDGRILCSQFVEPKLGNWVIRATARFLADHGAGFIRARASNPDKFALMEGAGFFLSKTLPVYWHSRQLPIPSQIDAGYLRGDDAMPWQALRSRRLAQQSRVRRGLGRRLDSAINQH